MTIIVCGGREFLDRDHLFASLDRLHQETPITLLVHGAADGADTLAGEWAESRDVPCEPCPPNLEKYGRAAVTIRSQALLDDFQPQLVVAFSGGIGTSVMVGLARVAGVRIVQM